jgi:hypothetical protein
MSESYDTSANGAAVDQHGYDHHEHDQAYADYSASQTQDQQYGYEHGHHVEYDDGHGGHYEESDYTVAAEHDTATDSAHAVQYSEHDASLYASDTFVQEADQQLHAFESGHVVGGTAQHTAVESGHSDSQQPATTGSGHLGQSPDQSSTAHYGS